MPLPDKANVTWTIYDNPKDCPGMYVMRKFIGGEPTHEVYSHKDIHRLRDLMIRSGRACFTRSEGDDAAIVETWL
jgi:hypothetical protein